MIRRRRKPKIPFKNPLETSFGKFILDTDLSLSLNSKIFKLQKRKISIFHNCSNFNKKKYKSKKWNYIAFSSYIFRFYNQFL